MPESGYNISLYSPGSLPQVIDVLRHLWGDDHDNNFHYFSWKYEDNPYVSLPLGVVAAKGSEVVGFRGYFATKWHLPSKDREIIVLCPGDTCVHPDHRRKGLSVKMGRVAMEAYASEYNVFFNHSATHKSTPGYLKMGFAPLITKTILTRCNVVGAAKFILQSALKLQSRRESVREGPYDDIVVSYAPKPEEMAALHAKLNRKGQRFSLLQDEIFFRWRFNNRKNKYIFYYLDGSDSLTGYLVVRLAGNRGRGYICDYGAADTLSLERILSFINRSRHFDVLSIHNFNIAPDFLRILNRQGFQADNLIRPLEKKITGEWPLLVRPVKRQLSESDWFIEGLDIRNIANWDVKAICSDAS